MQITSKKYFFFGILIFLVLIVSYFVKFDIDSGANYNIEERLLGVIIFHNPFILGIYLLIGIILILRGIIYKR